MEDNFVRFKNMCNMGDLISMMAGIKEYCEETGKKAIIYQLLNVRNDYYIGAKHPIKDDGGNQVCMNEHTFWWLKRLITKQDYIADYLIYEGQEIDFDLDLVRTKFFANIPNGAVQNWSGLGFPELQCDISQSWMDAEPIEKYKNKTIITFTERYRNGYMQFYFLKPYEQNIYFAGLPYERDLFAKRWGLDIKLIDIKDAYELAGAVKACKFFMGNQSFIYNLADALKVPRLLEVCAQMQNSIHGIGKKSYGYLDQPALENRFKKLYNM